MWHDVYLGYFYNLTGKYKDKKLLTKRLITTSILKRIYPFKLL